MTTSLETGTACSLPPMPEVAEVLLEHGSGGRMTQQLIEQLLLPPLGGPAPGARHDGAVFQLGHSRVALTTGSFVVRPLFFPGGDIGMLAVNGTINNLAMCGAFPLFISAALILAEGLPTRTLHRVVTSMGRAATAAGVRIVTGDTKVVDREAGDGIYVSTTGIGLVPRYWALQPSAIKPGDAIVLSGDIGRHGAAVLTARDSRSLPVSIDTDSTALSGPVLELLESGIEVHCLRDPTRGGVGTALAEIAEVAGLEISIYERLLPVAHEVQHACDLLGVDPLFLPNHGRFLAFVSPQAAEWACELLREWPASGQATIIGRVTGHGARGCVTLESRSGSGQVLDPSSGEGLSRLC